MNPRSLIQPLDILSVKLIGTHNNNMLIDWNINSGKNDVTLYHNLCGKKKKKPPIISISLGHGLSLLALF